MLLSVIILEGIEKNPQGEEMKTIIYENGLRAQSCEKKIKESRLASRYEEVIILPIPSTRDGVTVNGCSVTLDEALADASESTLVIGYSIPGNVRSRACSLGAAVCDSELDEGFTRGNAELTALAALGINLNTEQRAPADLSVGIIGYGRIGSQLTRLLLFLGTRVRVYTRKESVMLGLAECGVSSMKSDDAADLSDIDVLVNTAPARIFDRALCASEDMRIIDLASGDNFPCAARVEKYPSLPARTFPVTAGRLWAESVERFLLLGGSFEGESDDE